MEDAMRRNKPFVYECAQCGVFSEMMPRKNICVCGSPDFIKTPLEVGPDDIDD